MHVHVGACTGSQQDAHAHAHDTDIVNNMERPLAERSDCSVVTPPVDTSPVRSPQAVHSLIADVVRGASVVEIGTRNGDGMACFARTAAHAVAIEVDTHYCAKLRDRATNAASEKQLFSVSCASYSKKGGLPDADYYTWWQQVPALVNHNVLDLLGRRVRAGTVRLNATALVLFDAKHFPDKRSWDTLQKYAKWHRTVKFDESRICSSFRRKESPQPKAQPTA